MRILYQYNWRCNLCSHQISTSYTERLKLYSNGPEVVLEYVSGQYNRIVEKIEVACVPIGIGGDLGRLAGGWPAGQRMRKR